MPSRLGADAGVAGERDRRRRPPGWRVRRPARSPRARACRGCGPGCSGWPWCRSRSRAARGRASRCRRARRGARPRRRRSAATAGFAQRPFCSRAAPWLVGDFPPRGIVDLRRIGYECQIRIWATGPSTRLRSLLRHRRPDRQGITGGRRPVTLSSSCRGRRDHDSGQQAAGGRRSNGSAHPSPPRLVHRPSSGARPSRDQFFHDSRRSARRSCPAVRIKVGHNTLPS